MTDSVAKTMLDLANRKALAERLKAHAEKHYEDGWDTFVECYDMAELEEFVDDMTTWAEVKEMALKLVSVWEDRRADAASYREEF